MEWNFIFKALQRKGLHGHFVDFVLVDLGQQQNQGKKGGDLTP